MKILFINPPFAKYGGIEGHGGRSAPLNLGYLAAYLRQQKSDLDISILDCEAIALSYEQIKDYLNGYGPDVAAITMATPAYQHVLTVARMVKEVNPLCSIIVGGPHPTALPNETLLEKDIDFAVIGEGELTFVELIEKIEKGENFNSVKGLAYKNKNGEIFINASRPLIENLDILPFPAKDLLPLNAYFLPPTKRITGGASTNMVTSRGCPFNCTFCMAKTVWNRKTRFRSIKNVIDEIEEDVKKYQHVDFTFHDEFFTINHQRVKEFCEELQKRKLQIKWFCQARCGTINEETLRLMKGAGCERIGFGFESGDERILGLMQKNNNLEKARESAKICKKVGIKIAGAFILGYPGETEESIKRTIDFAKEIDPDSAAFFIAIPYPGTELFRMALENNYLKRPIDWKTFAPLSKDEPPLEIPNLTKQEVVRLKKYAYRSFYLRPQYVLRRLAEIKNISDIINLLRGLNIFKQVV